MVENPMVVGNQHDKSNGDDGLFGYDINSSEIYYGDEYLKIGDEIVLSDYDSILEYLREHLGATEHVAEE